MSDYLVRVISKSGGIRGLACITTDAVREACERHETLPTAAVALGRALTGGALMGALLKTGQRVALRFEGNGPLKKILVEAESTGAVRGYVGNPALDLPPVNGKYDIQGALGRAGFLTVTKDLGMKEPYRGVVQLYRSEIGEDLAYYLTESEQIPSAVGVGVSIDAKGAVAAAGGFLIQDIPPGDPEAVERLMAQIGQLPPLSDLLQRQTPEELLALLFAGTPYQLLEKRAVAFACSCSREKIERVLISLGRQELEGVLAEQEGAEVSCEFCRKRYAISAQELEALIAETTA